MTPIIQGKATSGQWPNIHCLVHPWFDTWEHENFEASLYQYISHIAEATNDILLIVTDGESFDKTQLEKFAHLDVIDAISLYLSLKDWWIGELIDVYDKQGNYSSALSNNGLSEEFYQWCEQNINMSELKFIADEWKSLKKDYLRWDYIWDIQKHNTEAASLRDKEEQVKVGLDITSLSYKAIDEFWSIIRRNMTYRNIGNRGRFFRLFQHAMDVLWKERVREVFIADWEDAEVLPIQPISHFQVFKWERIPTPLGEKGVDSEVFNASESSVYWNAASLRDSIIYELSVSRHEKLSSQQPQKVISDMWIDITPDTIFTFLWEYRNRCVTNVRNVMNHRIAPTWWGKFYVANDVFTLRRPSDDIGID